MSVKDQTIHKGHAGLLMAPTFGHNVLPSVADSNTPFTKETDRTYNGPLNLWSRGQAMLTSAYNDLLMFKGVLNDSYQAIKNYTFDLDWLHNKLHTLLHEVSNDEQSWLGWGFGGLFDVNSIGKWFIRAKSILLEAGMLNNEKVSIGALSKQFLKKILTEEGVPTDNIHLDVVKGLLGSDVHSKVLWACEVWDEIQRVYHGKESWVNSELLQRVKDLNIETYLSTGEKVTNSEFKNDADAGYTELAKKALNNIGYIIEDEWAIGSMKDDKFDTYIANADHYKSDIMEIEGGDKENIPVVVHEKPKKVAKVKKPKVVANEEDNNEEL